VSPSATGDYLKRVHRGQEACMQRLEAIQGSDAGLKISKVPFFDMVSSVTTTIVIIACDVMLQALV
jgi:hypothetical protein